MASNQKLETLATSPDINLSPRARALLMRVDGCVLRSLESVAGGHLVPDPLILQRIHDQNNLPSISDLRADGATNPVEAGVMHEIRNMLKLIHSAMEDQSPFGQGLARYNPSQVIMGEHAIKSAVKQQTPIILIGTIDSASVDYHAMHVGLDPEGELISLSDPDMPGVIIPSNEALHTIVFQPRK